MPPIDFCRMIAKRITSEYNQHATLLIWASTGAGKSYAGMSICEKVSQYVAEIKGGEPTDYFDVDNIAIITQAEIIRILSTKMDTRYCCIMTDDVGTGWNSRDFMTEFNRLMNDIWQTFRTRNNFLCLTLPDPMLIDKVPRDMVKYVAKIEASHFDFGYVEAKIQEPMKKVQWGKKIYPYLLDLDGQRIVRHIIFRPSQHLIDNYEPRRSLIEKQNTGTALQDMGELIQTESLPYEPRLSKKALFSTPMKADYNNGDGLSMSKIAEKYHVSSQTVYEALHYKESKPTPQLPEPKKTT